MCSEFRWARSIVQDMRLLDERSSHLRGGSFVLPTGMRPMRAQVPVADLGVLEAEPQQSSAH
eukprot:5138063-Amphidinium_carterae.1